MAGMDRWQLCYVVTAFLFQLVLIAHFALRRWRFPLAIRYGPLVYGLSLPAAAISLALLANGLAWGFWVGGFIYLVWAIFGYRVEYVRQIAWRDPVRWPVLAPYVLLYLATVMFYWWPLGQISRPLWAAQGALFAISTGLNLASHRRPQQA